jgi:hypothetical protein
MKILKIKKQLNNLKFKKKNKKSSTGLIFIDYKHTFAFNLSVQFKLLFKLTSNNTELYMI